MKNLISNIFILTFLVLPFTDGQAKDIEKSKKLVSFKYLSTLYIDEIIAIKPTEDGSYDKKLIEKLYQKILVDGTLVNFQRMEAKVDLFNKNPNYKALYNKYLKSMDREKYNLSHDTTREEQRYVNQRLEYLDLDAVFKDAETYQKEYKQFSPHLTYKSLYKASLRCGKNRQIHCAFKLRGIMIERMMGNLHKIADSIDDYYPRQNKEGRIKLALTLNPKKVEEIMSKEKKIFLEEIEDLNKNIISIITDYSHITKMEIKRAQ